MTPTAADVERARERLAGVARVTPVVRSATFSRLAGRDVWLKAENLQRTGSFKVRGAVNRLAALGEEERARGVVAASAGNHGQAVAWAAREAGVPATIVVPQDAPMTKVEATRSYGATVEMTGASFEEAVATGRHLASETGAVYVHAFEDGAVIAGQGTVGLEVVEQLPDVEAIVVPVGGGGLVAGIALALPGVPIIGVRTGHEGFAVADGIAVKELGELPRAILGDTVDAMVEVSSAEIAQAIVLVLERTKLLVEGAGAAGVAALLSGQVAGDGPVAVVLSGGNVDATTLISVMRHGLTLAGRYLVVRTRVPDRPGELQRLLDHVTAERINVIDVEHRREGAPIAVGETEIWLTLETRDEAHASSLLDTMRSWGYDVARVA
ncbi:MAG TPA: threonine ammonia-lyase [Gaiellaceae bacterium]|nr:threonine ammonia-lyase [Gaiellaceae bacterium]